MGKRELLIVATFVVVGIAVYHLTASESTEGNRRFSLASLMDHFREAGGRRATASVTTRGTFELDQTLAEVRISGIANVTITGETRDDIAYSLTIESTGPDEETARASAARTALTRDHLGAILALRANAPREVRQRASLALSVPSRFQIRVEGVQGAANLEATGVAGVQLDGVIGDVKLTDVDVVTGAHRNGDLAISNSGSVDLTLVSSRAVLDGIREAIAIEARNGRCRITGAAGPIEFNGSNEETVVTAPQGTVRVTGSGGTLSIEDPHAEVNVDVRRSTVDVTLTRPAPLTILTTDEPLRLRLSDQPGVTLDAVSTDGGTIVADDVGATVETTDDETRLRHVFGAASIPVALRNRRGPIEISRTK